jgi:hypothetical protein
VKSPSWRSMRLNCEHLEFSPGKLFNSPRDETFVRLIGATGSAYLQVHLHFSDKNQCSLRLIG